MQISQPEHTGKHSHAPARCPRRLGGGKQTPTGGAEEWEPMALGSLKDRALQWTSAFHSLDGRDPRGRDKHTNSS